MDQEARLQLVYETVQRPEELFATLGLVPRHRVESREELTESCCVPDVFLFHLDGARIPTDEVRGASGH